MKKTIGTQKFIKINDISKQDIPIILKTKCYIMTVRFRGIKSTTTHGIKYSSKFISVVNPIIEKNGRIHAADILEVILTGSDYARYKKLCTWDDMEIIELQMKNLTSHKLLKR